MKIPENKEYDFLKKDSRLGKNIILLGLGGSYAYGTNVEGSDLDIRGIASRTRNDFLLGKDYEQFVDNKTDTVIYTLDKMFTLLTNCNPNTIEILGLKPDQYFWIDNIGQKLLDHKDIFLSKRCIHTFGGYANQQLYRLKQKTLSALSVDEYNDHISKVLSHMIKTFKNKFQIEDQIVPLVKNGGLYLQINNLEILAQDLNGILGELNKTIQDYLKPSKRNEKAIQHNKVTKHSMHLIRLYMMVIDILKDHEINTYREREHNLLMEIRNGRYLDSTGKPNKEFWDIQQEYELKFKEAQEKTTLPDEPNFKAIEDLKVELNELSFRDVHYPPGYLDKIKLKDESNFDVDVIIEEIMNDDLLFLGGLKDE